MRLVSDQKLAEANGFSSVEDQIRFAQLFKKLKKTMLEKEAWREARKRSGQASEGEAA